MSNEVFNLLEGSIVQVKTARQKGRRTKKEKEFAEQQANSEPQPATTQEPGMVLPEPGATPPSPFPPKDKEARKQWEQEWRHIYENNLCYNETCWQEVVF